MGSFKPIIEIALASKPHPGLHNESTGEAKDKPVCTVDPLNPQTKRLR